MDLSFLVSHYDFEALRRHALYVSDKVDVQEICLSFDKPSPTIKKLFAENAKSPDITLIPDDIGQQEMVAWNGLWLVAKSNQEWAFIATKGEVLGKPYWLIDLEFEAANFQLEFIKQLFLELAEMIQPDLAMGYDEYGAPYNMRYFSSELGPWTGLRDVYWLNYWGKEYSDLIGIDRVRKSPEVNSVVEMFGRGIFFVVDKSHLGNREQVINSIGSEFFIKEHLDGGARQSSGLLALFKTLYQLSKDDSAERKVAERRPDVFM